MSITDTKLTDIKEMPLTLTLPDGYVIDHYFCGLPVLLLQEIAQWTIGLIVPLGDIHAVSQFVWGIPAGEVPAFVCSLNKTSATLGCSFLLGSGTYHVVALLSVTGLPTGGEIHTSVSAWYATPGASDTAFGPDTTVVCTGIAAAGENYQFEFPLDIVVPSSAAPAKIVGVSVAKTDNSGSGSYDLHVKGLFLVKTQ